MARRVSPFVLLLAVALPAAGCGFFGRPERPAWRAQAENACFAESRVKLSPYIVERSAIDGPGICGMERPLRVSALDDGAVGLDKTLTVDCPMTAALQVWLDEVVQPDAQARFGQKVATVNVFGAYSCRSIDNQPGARLSEHAFGNAVDVSGFTLADGRRIDIVKEWKAEGTQESAFLHEVHAGACQTFTTVLGPGADVFHYNHIHIDLARHGRTNTGLRHICKPAPAPSLLPPPAAPDGLPPSPEIDEPLDISQAGAARATALAPASAPITAPGDSLSVALPPAAIGDMNPAPPVLPEGDGPAIDPTPTSSIPYRDD